MIDVPTTAWLLFAAGTLTVAASSPMFRSHFRHAIASARPPVKVPPVSVLFAAEAVKCALFSALAAWAGARAASAAGLDAGLASPLAAPLALLAGLVAAAVEHALGRALPPPSPPARAPMPLAARLTGVFYMAVAIELWFRWGVLAPAALGLEHAGLPRASALAGAVVVSALAYGVFAIPSSIGAHRGAPRAAVARRAIVCTGVPSLVFGATAATLGLGAAMIAHAAAFAVTAAREARASASAEA